MKGMGGGGMLEKGVREDEWKMICSITADHVESSKRMLQLKEATPAELQDLPQSQHESSKLLVQPKEAISAELQNPHSQRESSKCSVQLKKATAAELPANLLCFPPGCSEGDY
eukprot:1162137-Pelagomonas_calceolata.AAC.10